jgi:hypothetical protein
MKLSLAGNAVPWMMNTSRPRTFSSTLTKRLPSENLITSEAPSSMPRLRAMALPRLRLAEPANTGMSEMSSAFMGYQPSSDASFIPWEAFGPFTLAQSR